MSENFLRLTDKPYIDLTGNSELIDEQGDVDMLGTTPSPMIGMNENAFDEQQPLNQGSAECEWYENVDWILNDIGDRLTRIEENEGNISNTNGGNTSAAIEKNTRERIILHIFCIKW